MKTTRMLTILVLVAAVLLGSGQEASGGTLAAWGLNDYGQCDVPAGDDFTAIAAGGLHSLALKSDGSLAAWGRNDYGQCDVPVGKDFAVISGGGYHSLALKSEGSIVAWGVDDGGTYDYGQVTDVPTGDDFVAVAGGGLHSLALKSDGSLAAWGIDDGSTFDLGQVTNVPAGTDFAGIAAGGYHSLALRSDGSLAAWGYNYDGECNVPAGNDFVGIAAGTYHSLALKSDGSLAAWGQNYQGQCDVPGGNDFVAVAAGGYHSLALKSDGSLAAWGRNDHGQCDVPAGNDFVAIAGGGYHNLAIATAPMGTAFTYQGRLLDEGSPAEGLYDFQFKLYNANVAGLQQGSTIDINDLDVIDGQFAIELDFGSEVFKGDARWLETGVRPGEMNDPNVYTTLSPRQEVTPTPYALYAKTAGYAETASGIPGGISGGGTTNYIAKFTEPNTIGDSVIYESAGNVGIGTTSPTAKLHIGGTAGVDGLRFPDGTLQTTAGGGGGDSDWIISGDDMYSGVSGNVGIGTISPNAKLEIGGAGAIRTPFLDPAIIESSSKSMIFGSLGERVGVFMYNKTDPDFGDGNDFTICPYAGRDLVLKTSGEGQTHILGGNVGIGTTTPEEKLHVAGNYIRVDGAGGEAAYIGGDGLGNDVQLGSLNPNVEAVNLWNAAAGERMNLIVGVLDITGGSDLAEPFAISDEEKIPEGSLVVIDDENPGQLKLSDRAYDTRVAGIISGAAGVKPGLTMSQADILEGGRHVALAGRVYALADASYGAIKAGDLLTTSNTPGHTMKATDRERSYGAVIGKAMSALNEGKGLVLVLVTLQ